MTERSGAVRGDARDGRVVLRRILRQLGWTPTKLAAAAGLSHTTVTRYLGNATRGHRGSRGLGVAAALKIDRALARERQVGAGARRAFAEAVNLAEHAEHGRDDVAPAARIGLAGSRPPAPHPPRQSHDDAGTDREVGLAGAPIDARAIGRPDPELLSHLLLDARQHIANARTPTDRVVAAALLAEVQARTAEQTAPVYRGLGAWASQLAGAHLVELGQSEAAGRAFARALADAAGLADAPPAGIGESTGNLLLAARHGLAVVAQSAGWTAEALEHLDWWWRNRSQLDDPHPHVWAAEIERMRLVADVRLGRLGEANRVWDRLAGLLPRLPIEQRLLAERSHAHLLIAQGAGGRQAARRLLVARLDWMAQTRRAGGIAAAPRVELALIQTLLTDLVVTDDDWDAWAVRAAEIIGPGVFPGAIEPIARAANARRAQRWRALLAPD